MRKFYYCENCHHVYTANIIEPAPQQNDKIVAGFFTSYQCDCGSDAVEVDEMLLSTIVELNNLGLLTDYCCEGHLEEDSSFCSAYIMFKPVSDESIDIKQITDKIGLPENWDLFSEETDIYDAYMENGIIKSTKTTEKVYKLEVIPIEYYDSSVGINNNRILVFPKYKTRYLTSLYVWMDKLVEYYNSNN